MTHLGEFGIGSLYAMLQSVCEFRDYQIIERHTLLRDVNGLLSSFFISFWYNSVWGMCTRMYWLIVSFMKMRAIEYLKAKMNFWLHFPHFLSVVVGIWYKRSACNALSICDFLKIGTEKATLFVCVYRETIQHFENKKCPG